MYVAEIMSSTTKEIITIQQDTTNDLVADLLDAVDEAGTFPRGLTPISIYKLPEGSDDVFDPDRRHIRTEQYYVT